MLHKYDLYIRYSSLFTRRIDGPTRSLQDARPGFADTIRMWYFGRCVLR